MAEKIYPKGIISFAPREGAPSFVVSTIKISVDELIEWLNENKESLSTDYKGKKQITLNQTVFDGKISLSVDTYGLNPAPDAPKKQSEESVDKLPF